MYHLKSLLCMVLLVAGYPASSLAAADKTAESAMESTVAPMPASGKKLSRKEIRKHWQALIDQVLPLATVQISKTATFFPFAAVQDHDGRIRIVSAEAGAPGASPAAALGALRKELSALARSGRVNAVVYLADAAVTRKDTGLRQTGIRIKLDHVSGQAMEGFLPYVRQDDGSLNLLTPEYRPSPNVTFP